MEAMSTDERMEGSRDHFREHDPQEHIAAGAGYEDDVVFEDDDEADDDIFEDDDEDDEFLADDDDDEVFELGDEED
jgi:hypothetical protein